jgi:hypothetical protein
MAGRRRALDVALIVWAVAWVWVGVWVAREVQGLARIAETVRTSGVALQSAGDVLRGLDGLPFVGDDLSGPAEAITEAGRSAVESARLSEENAREVGLLLGASIALIPSLPLLILYVPQRVIQERERRMVLRLMRRGDDERLEEVLAVRAQARLPLDTLMQLSDPHDRASLAKAEMERLGVEEER